eukprot:m.338335 g.338335  ORF g.338335 m.338335 type:complete len:362 (-) comp18387_c0_seq1:856-1941(-)
MTDTMEEMPTSTLKGRALQSAMQTLRGSVSFGGSTIIEKVHYKGFVNCDHPTRLPNEYTIQGLHDIFTNKKQMKLAQDENPLAGRGFKKAVLLMCSYDGFRLDMFSKAEEGAILHFTIDKVVAVKAIDRFVYIIVKRGKQDGKYTCQCIFVDAKLKTMPETIEKFLLEAMEDANRLGLSPLQNKKRGASIRDDEESARLRSLSEAFRTNADLVDTTGKMGLSQKAYLSDQAAKENDALTEEDRNKVQAMFDNSTTGKAALESKPWYHGDIERVVAERRLLDCPRGTFLIRVSSDKSNYSLSLVISGGKVRHFKILKTDQGRWNIQGHAQSYISVGALVMHYSEADITAEGDRCGQPCLDKS